ncbi:MAG: hypothetical protein U0174_02460 [Polyangiaceae bacterium]
MRPFALLASLCTLTACAGSTLRPFPLEPPRTTDPDRDAVYVACRQEARDDGSKRTVCAPEPRAVPAGWDLADTSLYSPMSRGLGIELAKPSLNVNALDEVPDSSWFSNRAGLGPDEVFRGACAPLTESIHAALRQKLFAVDVGLETNRPVFRLREPAEVVLRGDTSKANERATAASVIASRLFWAAGYNVPCEDIVYVPKDSLSVKDGLLYPDTRVSRMVPLTRERVTQVLASLPTRDGAIRFQWSNPIPGYAIGPWRFEGFRRDDPNDVVPHENRREVRASRILASWLDYYEIRAKSTMASFISVASAQEGASPGIVRHYFMDFAGAFGAPAEPDAAQRRIGHSYGFDLEHVGADFVTLGLLSRPWYDAKPSPFPEVFGYYSADLFDPAQWKPQYANPAYSFMQDEDAAWMARVLVRLTPQLVRAAVRAGRLDNPAEEAYLASQLLRRRAMILRRYFALRSPLSNISIRGRRICAEDLARSSGAIAATGYSAHFYKHDDAKDAGPLLPKVEGVHVCVDVPPPDPGEFDGVGASDLRRYAVVDFTSSVVKGVLRVHVYDQGPERELTLVGLERPRDRKPPR